MHKFDKKLKSTFSKNSCKALTLRQVESITSPAVSFVSAFKTVTLPKKQAQSFFTDVIRLKQQQ